MEYNGYVIEPDGAWGMKRIRSKGSGALPKTLHGSYTNVNLAKRAIDTFLAQKEAKVNGKEASSG